MKTASLSLMLLMALFTATGTLAAKTIEIAKGTTLVLQDEPVEGEEDLVQVHLSYQCGLLDDPKGSAGAMAVVAALAFETAGARGSANYEAELKALAKVDELEQKVSALEAKKKLSDQEQKELESLRSELADQKLGTDFLGVGAPLNDLYFAANASLVAFTVSPEFVTYSITLPRKALPLVFDVESERRRAVPFRKLSSRIAFAADVAVYAIRDQGIKRDTLANKYLRSAGGYGDFVKAKYDYETFAAFDRPVLYKLWSEVLSKAPLRIAIGLPELSDAELKEVKKKFTPLDEVRKPAFAKAKEWRLSQVHLNGDQPRAERWYALQAQENISQEQSRRLSAWLEDNFDNAQKGLSHTIRWLPQETLVGFVLSGDSAKGLKVDELQTTLRSALTLALSKLAEADLSLIEMKNLRHDLRALARQSSLAKSSALTATSLAKLLGDVGAIEIVSMPPQAANDDAEKAKGDALKEVMQGVSDEKRLAELRRILAKLEAGEGE